MHVQHCRPPILTSNHLPLSNDVIPVIFIVNTIQLVNKRELEDKEKTHHKYFGIVQYFPNKKHTKSSSKTKSLLD